jgi:hypothetical protein
VHRAGIDRLALLEVAAISSAWGLSAGDCRQRVYRILMVVVMMMVVFVHSAMILLTDFLLFDR